MKKTGSIFVAALSACLAACTAGVVLEETFETRGAHWVPVGSSLARIVDEPSLDNRVLQLTPIRRELSYVLFETGGEIDSFEMTGRVLFPTSGDGYLGFIYSYRTDGGRTDYGCLYIKSNGSYIRFSPHFDGNPSWRLFEELRVDLSGDRRIQVGRWYPFRLVVDARTVALYLDSSDEPVFSTSVIRNPPGRVGLEARPGGGDPVWVDDIRIRRLAQAATSAVPASVGDDSVPRLSAWEVYEGPLNLSDKEPLPALPDADAWTPAMQDARGAVIPAAHARTLSNGDRDVVVRSRFDAYVRDKDVPTRLHLSSANDLTVWLNGQLVGTVARGDYIWSDHASNVARKGTTIALQPKAGENEITILVKGGRFAGGGMFVELE